MQALYSNAVEGCVVQHHNSICIQGEALESEQGVVGLHHHIAGLILVGKHTADGVMSSQQGARTVYHCAYVPCGSEPGAETQMLTG